MTLRAELYRQTALLFCTKVPWFSKCNVVILVFELTKELKLFIKEDKKIEDKFSNNCFLQQLAYLADVFEHLNILNLKLQGPEMIS